MHAEPVAHSPWRAIRCAQKSPHRRTGSRCACQSPASPNHASLRPSCAAITDCCGAGNFNNFGELFLSEETAPTPSAYNGTASTEGPAPTKDTNPHAIACVIENKRTHTGRDCFMRQVTTN